MGKRAHTLLTIVACVALLPRCHSQGEGDSQYNCSRVTEWFVYTECTQTFNTGKAVHPEELLQWWLTATHTTAPSYLGAQFPLELRSSYIVWRVIGLPYGTPLSYTTTCPSGLCEVEGYYSRKIFNEHILAINTTSTSDGRTYTCRVTAREEQEATGSFQLWVAGMSYILQLYIYICILR